MLKTYKVVDEAGLHARPASLMVGEAMKSTNEVNIIYKDKKLTMKSIMAVMSLGVPCGDEFSIEVVGENEETLMESFERILVANSVI